MFNVMAWRTIGLLSCIVGSIQAYTPVLEKNKLPGIWKLDFEDSKLEEIGIRPQEEDILLKLNQDGSFRQCNEGYVEGRWIKGCWDYIDSEIYLAMDRQYYGPRHDILLTGRPHPSQNDVVIQGNVATGKFMYPKKHPSFFDSPIVGAETRGSFSLLQVLSYFKVDNVQDKQEASSVENQEYTVKDFYGRQFYMTIVPVGQQKGVRQYDRVRGWHYATDNQPVDIRAMPIEFFQNNTFTCHATNKILRGRFVVQNDELCFEVSLFGAGRSMKGSVYSEGIGLTHEDKRNYVGRIETEETSEGEKTLRVEGAVTFGSDLGSDARPEPVGKFILREVTDETPLLDDYQDDLSDSVFE